MKTIVETIDQKFIDNLKECIELFANDLKVATDPLKNILQVITKIFESKRHLVQKHIVRGSDELIVEDNQMAIFDQEFSEK